MADIEVRKNDETHRFEAIIDGEVAGFADFADDEAGTLVLPHTVVDDKFGGKGVGSALARSALAEAIEKGRAVAPVCPFIKGWIDKHPDVKSQLTLTKPKGFGGGGSF